MWAVPVTNALARPSGSCVLQPPRRIDSWPMNPRRLANTARANANSATVSAWASVALIKAMPRASSVCGS